MPPATATEGIEAISVMYFSGLAAASVALQPPILLNIKVDFNEPDVVK